MKIFIIFTYNIKYNIHIKIKCRVDGNVDTRQRAAKERIAAIMITA